MRVVSRTAQLSLGLLRSSSVPQLGLEDGRLLDQSVDLPALAGQDDGKPQEPDENHNHEQHEEQAGRIENPQQRGGLVQEVSPNGQTQERGGAQDPDERVLLDKLSPPDQFDHSRK